MVCKVQTLSGIRLSYEEIKLYNYLCMEMSLRKFIRLIWNCSLIISVTDKYFN